MRKLNQEELLEVIECNAKSVVVLTEKNCAKCLRLKDTVIPVLQQKFPLLPFVEYEAVENVYPVNELSEKFKFKTVPVIVLYEGDKAVRAVVGEKGVEEYVKMI